MPQLGKYNYLLDVTVFLYANVDDAQAGVRSGGTGFMIGYTVPGHNVISVYCVTNWHVACQRGFSTIRINGKSGVPDILEFDPSEWIFIPGKNDVAAIPLRLDADKHKVAVLDGSSYLITEHFMKSHEMGPGEDVFMVGRFIDHDGIEVNVPSLRFGHISITRASIEQPTGYNGESVLIDVHSRTGYSGSPVFVYRTAGSAFLEPGMLTFGHTLMLLGILWGQFPERWELEREKREVEAHSPAASLITEGEYVKGLSGMSCVCPAWAIAEVLDLPKLRENRERLRVALDALPPNDSVSKARPMAASEVSVKTGTDKGSYAASFYQDGHL